MPRAARNTPIKLPQHQVNYDSYLRAIGHDLGAPIRHVRGFSRLLSDEIGPALEAESSLLLQQIQDSAELAEKMIYGLHDIALLGSGFRPAQASSMAELTESALAELPASTLSTQVIGDASAAVDSQLYRALVHCLAQNTRQYACSANLTIYIEQPPTQAGAVRVTFTDPGPGFEVEQWPLVLNPFNRLGAKPTLKSLGLGLTKVAQIACLHEAVLWCQHTQAGCLQIGIQFQSRV